MASNGGFTRRANSATPTASASTDPDVRAALETWLSERGSPLVVRMTPLAPASVEARLLAGWGLVSTDETVVMTKKIGGSATGALSFEAKVALS
jgi:hypothetical protein